jgi:hypothetical protein
LSPRNVRVSATVRSTYPPHTARSTCLTESPESPITVFQCVSVSITAT